MTSIVLSVAMLLTPAPLVPKEPPPWPKSLPPVSIAMSDPATWFWPPEIRVEAESLFAPTESPAQNVVLPPPDLPPILSPIELGMSRLAELGATEWQLRTFGCLAWFESKNDPNAVSWTNDRGLWQIHFPLHAWRFGGRDWRDPVANADVAWDIYRESGFRAWTTHGLCGV